MQLLSISGNKYFCPKKLLADFTKKKAGRRLFLGMGAFALSLFSTMESSAHANAAVQVTEVTSAVETEDTSQIPDTPDTETTSTDSSKITAAGEDLSVCFSYGFDKSSKYGRQLNVIAHVTNNGADFSGTIGIISLPNDASDKTLYEVPCVIAGGETKKIELTALSSANNWPSLMIKDDNEKVVLQKSFRVTMTAQMDIVFTAVLTDEPEDLSYISSAGLSKLFFLDETTLPSTAAGLDSLDIIMISNFNTDRLSKEQVDAILAWTKKGGMLVFGTGATATKTLSAFQGSLFNGTISETEKRPTLLGMTENEFLALKDELYYTIDQALDEDEMNEIEEQLKKQEAAEASSVEIITETSPAGTDEPEVSIDGRISKDDIESLTLKPMSKDMVLMEFEQFSPVLSEEDDFPLIVKKNHGNGTVLAAAFELGMAARYRTSMGTQLYQTITDNFSKTKKAQLSEGEYYNYYDLSRALGVNGMSSYPNLKLFFIILVVYAVFTGPVLYFILKKLDKRHLLWGLMPASCLVCTAMIYLIGGSTRISEPFIHYLSFLQMDQNVEESLPTQKVYFNVTAPYNKKYSITLPGITDVEVRSEYDYYSYSYSNEEPRESTYYKTALYRDGSNQTTLIMNDYAAFHAASFECTSNQEESTISGRFDSDLKLKKDLTVTGTLTNNLGIDLHQAIYICNGQLYILGGMKNGDTVSLKDCEMAVFNSVNSLESITLSSGRTPLEEIAGGYGWDSENDPLVRQVYFAFEYYLNNSASTLSNTGLFTDTGRIIAVTEDGSVDFLENSGLNTNGLRLLDIRLEPPMRDSMTAESIDLSFHSVIEGSMDYPYYRYLSSTQTVTFQIENPETVTALVYDKSGNGEFTYTDHVYNYYDFGIFKGTISAYNLITGEYDELFTGGEAGICEDLTPYLSASGQITISYQPEVENDYTYNIPVLYLLRK